MKKRMALAAILMLAALSAAAHAQRRAAVQDVFASEEPIRRPMAMPYRVLGQIAKGEPDMVNACEGSLKGKITASAFDINGDGTPDVIAQGTDGCAMGAHSTNFWVFSKSKTDAGVDYDLVLSGPADILEVARTSTNGYRDISMSYHTAVEMFTTVWKFDGSKYQPRECFVESLETKRRRRTPCNQE